VLTPKALFYSRGGVSRCDVRLFPAWIFFLLSPPGDVSVLLFFFRFQARLTWPRPSRFFDSTLEPYSLIFFLSLSRVFGDHPPPNGATYIRCLRSYVSREIPCHVFSSFFSSRSLAKQSVLLLDYAFLRQSPSELIFFPPCSHPSKSRGPKGGQKKTPPASGGFISLPQESCYCLPVTVASTFRPFSLLSSPRLCCTFHPRVCSLLPRLAEGCCRLSFYGISHLCSPFFP